jgi:hypothetical protein
MPVYVGILTSTTFGGGGGSLGNDFKTAFEAGFRSTVTGSVNPTYATNGVIEAKGKYDSKGKIRKELYHGAKKLTKGANPAQVIVAVGGLVSVHAVVDKTDEVPFLVLTGRIPETGDFSLGDNDYYCGGVDLHTVHTNLDRRDALTTQFGLSANDIWLLYNPNSRIGESEANEWKSRGGNAFPVGSPGDDNDENDFAPAFNRLKKKNARGVVISADAFFSSKRNELVTAANTAATVAGGNMKMCYPFDIYGNATPPPSGGSGMSIGPKLLDAYTDVGKKAGSIVNSLTANPNAKPGFQGLNTASLLPQASWIVYP